MWVTPLSTAPPNPTPNTPHFPQQPIVGLDLIASGPVGAVPGRYVKTTMASETGRREATEAAYEDHVIRVVRTIEARPNCY